MASWRPALAMMVPPSQEFVQIPVQVQSKRPNYAPIPVQPNKPLQMNFGLRQPDQVPPGVPQRIEVSQVQKGFRKPMSSPVLDSVFTDKVVMDPGFVPKVPVPANTVDTQCGEVSVKVHVQQDFLGNGQFINPSDLTLGGCPFVGFDDHARIVAFESVLQGCGSTLAKTPCFYHWLYNQMTEDSLIYSFVLVYSPSPIPDTPIVKTNEAMVGIHCIYPRMHNVSSNALHPTWIPYAALRAGEEKLQFSLKLMTDDWLYERPSTSYFLGDFINIEASVVRANHVPLRVYVESCAATLGPGGNAVTVYTFVENHGCMIDAKLTGSRSKFMPRIQDDKLQFQIEAFRFQQDASGLIYITCHLKATTSIPIDPTHKACSFLRETNSWVSANGDDQMCECCKTSCAMRKARSPYTEDSTLEDEATVGPIFVQGMPTIDDKPLFQIQESSPISAKDAEFPFEFVLLTGLVVGVGILCIIILGTLFYQRRRKHLALTCE
ncbi:zona pellucida sperm-binding protein 3-like [Myxocyprinus asiaticus]|uniref:zona pellucida sperm-binding protein 3-like n=1 Tax=Myxocyprinus asiaticus TaxID=70543 RepID=UPI002223314F|nr:zona pellucida sperm-binding protein 3-like [Myxocyprinus asiaticus]